MSTDIGNSWHSWMGEAVELRRALHRKPEIAWTEQRTAATVRNQLDAIGIPWRPCATTGTLAELAGASTAPRIALRADIDGLAIHEQSGKAWASESPGLMHACGHDGHTATLLAAARWLKAHEQGLPQPVRLLFQPAEEGGHGAKAMIEDGALKNVSRIYGWHNWPALPVGTALCPDGAVMAGNGTFELLVTGQGGHSSQPELCRDPVLAAAAIVVALQQVVSRRMTPTRPTVVSVTSIEAPSGLTIIPHQAKLSGSIRLSDMADQQPLIDAIEQVAQFTAQAHGTVCELTFTPRYGPTVNHATPAGGFRQILLDELGANALNAPLSAPIMASEDFSYYLNMVPGAFALIGASPSSEAAPSCHSPHYDFNDDLIPVMARVFARLVGAPPPPAAP